MTENFYQKAEEFHEVFAPSKNKGPTAFTSSQALHRADFKVEELVEFLYATSAGDVEKFDELIVGLKAAVDKAVTKVSKQPADPEEILIGQVDALLDLLYFTYGSFALMKVDPEPLFNIVHEANMKKLFSDGKPHYDKVTGKVLKPEGWQENFAPESKLKTELLRQIAKNQ